MVPENIRQNHPFGNHPFANPQRSSRSKCHRPNTPKRAPSHWGNDQPYRNNAHPNMYPLAGDDRPLDLLKRAVQSRQGLLGQQACTTKLPPNCFDAIRKMVRKTRKRIRKRPETSLINLKPLSCCLKISHRHFSKNSHNPKFATQQKRLFTATLRWPDLRESIRRFTRIA